jgi:hypothetical protein
MAPSTNKEIVERLDKLETSLETSLKDIREHPALCQPIIDLARTVSVIQARQDDVRTELRILDEVVHGNGSPGLKAQIVAIDVKISVLTEKSDELRKFMIGIVAGVSVIGIGLLINVVLLHGTQLIGH